MSEPGILQHARMYLPKYLSPNNLQDLYNEIKLFPKNRPYYTSHPALDGKLLQGDGWHGFVVIKFDTLERRVVSGVVISNSCDVDDANPRPLPPNVLFAPILKLESYKAQLRAAKLGETQIEDHCVTLRQQLITSVFYLPEHGPQLPESIVLLHDIHGHPLPDFRARDRRCLFKLGQFAFYLFLLKLSIHFTRMQEGIARNPPVPPAASATAADELM